MHPRKLPGVSAEEELPQFCIFHAGISCIEYPSGGLQFYLHNGDNQKSGTFLELYFFIIKCPPCFFVGSVGGVIPLIHWRSPRCSSANVAGLSYFFVGSVGGVIPLIHSSRPGDSSAPVAGRTLKKQQ